MKKMKRVMLYLGMNSCGSSTKDVEPTSIHTLEKVLNTVQSPVWKPAGSKEEAFYDSKPWLDSDDESEFFSVNGDIPPYKQSDKNGDHQGRKLSELFKESGSFSSDSQTSVIATEEEKKDNARTPTFNSNGKLEKGKSSKSVKQHCLPSLVRSLSCGERKKRPRTANTAVGVAG
ncbi:hypothetical protein RDABS01_002335 [Bienertia sinuspersici]